MKATLTKWSLILLCIFMGAAIGGGFYEQVIMCPLWSAAPPKSFSIIQPGTGVTLETFWIPVHSVITLFLIISLVLTWRQARIRRLVLIGFVSYMIMRAWSFAYFIPEMLDFQRIPTSSPANSELLARVEKWTYWTWWREPLDIISMVCFLLALYSLNRTQLRVSTADN